MAAKTKAIESADLLQTHDKNSRDHATDDVAPHGFMAIQAPYSLTL